MQMSSNKLKIRVRLLRARVAEEEQRRKALQREMANIKRDREKIKLVLEDNKQLVLEDMMRVRDELEKRLQELKEKKETTMQLQADHNETGAMVDCIELRAGGMGWPM